MSLGRAREELRAALRLSRRFGKSADLAIILHNLAIAENQLNEFAESRRHFREAERLLVRAGERRNVIKIATNLAVIAAKLGEKEEAHVQIERASEMLRRYPGQQLEYFVAYARGITAHLFGDAEAAVAAFGEALPLGRKLGDRFLVTFGEVYLAEAHLMAGRYQEAWKVLRAAARSLGEGGPPLARRIVHGRLCVGCGKDLLRFHSIARARFADDEAHLAPPAHGDDHSTPRRNSMRKVVGHFVGECAVKRKWEGDGDQHRQCVIPRSEATRDL